MEGKLQNENKVNTASAQELAVERLKAQAEEQRLAEVAQLKHEEEKAKREMKETKEQVLK